MISYRNAGLKDKQDYIQLERDMYKLYEERGYDSYLSYIPSVEMTDDVLGNDFEASFHEDCFFYVAEDTGKVVGYIFAEIKPVKEAGLYTIKNTGHINSLIVADTYRGQGIGTVLIEKGLEWLMLKNVTICTLGVVRDNVDAIRLYEKLGFQIGKLQMWKKLT